MPRKSPRGKPKPVVETLPKLSMANASAPEGARFLTYVVLMDRTATQHVAFDYWTTAGTATAGVDFTPVSGTKIIPPGSVSATIDVPIIDDKIDEDGETVFMHVDNERFV